MLRDFPATLVIWTVIEGGFQKERQAVLLCPARPYCSQADLVGPFGGQGSAQGAALLERVGSLEEVDGLGVHHWMGTPRQMGTVTISKDEVSCPACWAPSKRSNSPATGSVQWEGPSWGQGAAEGSVQRSEVGSPKKQVEGASGKGSGGRGHLAAGLRGHGRLREMGQARGQGTGWGLGLEWCREVQA